MERYNLELAYEKVGSFGRMQWTLAFATCVTRNSGNFIYYCFAYLTLQQFYLCGFPSPGGETSYESCPIE